MTASVRKAGLGASIVQALAGQLKSTVEVSDDQPGAKVSINHMGVNQRPTQPAV